LTLETVQRTRKPKMPVAAPSPTRIPSSSAEEDATHSDHDAPQLDCLLVYTQSCQVETGSRPRRTITRYGLAERLGPLVLLLIGVALFLFATPEFITGNLTSGGALVAGAVITVILATGMSRMESLRFECVKLFRFIVRFRDRSPSEDMPVTKHDSQQHVTRS
jgi:hypothetical protein